MINNEEGQLIYSGIGDLKTYKHILSPLKELSYFIFFNTTITFILTSILFAEIQMVYNEVYSKNISETVSTIHKMLENVCVMVPEICENQNSNI